MSLGVGERDGGDSFRRRGEAPFDGEGGNESCWFLVFGGRRGAVVTGGRGSGRRRRGWQEGSLDSEEGADEFRGSDVLLEFGFDLELLLTDE